MEIIWLPRAAEADCKPVHRSAAPHGVEASPTVLATMGQHPVLAPEPTGRIGSSPVPLDRPETAPIVVFCNEPGVQLRQIDRTIIPSPGDQNLWAQSLRPMDQTCLKPVKPKRVTPSGTWYNALDRGGALVVTLGELMMILDLHRQG